MRPTTEFCSAAERSSPQSLGSLRETVGLEQNSASSRGQLRSQASEVRMGEGCDLIRFT